MWKILFEFADRFFAIVPVKKWRSFLRTDVLFDYRRKLNALRRARPELNFKKMRLAKGGGSIVFIVGNNTFKVRKHKTEQNGFARFDREKRITDALRPFCSIEIPNINFFKFDGFTFYESPRIPGKMLVDIPTRKIKEHQIQLSEQLAEFIYKKSFANPPEIADLRGGAAKSGYSWNHGDMCSNILVDPKTMRITGIIDWEWAKYSDIDNEFIGIVWVRKKMRKIGLDKTTRTAYDNILKKKSRN
jgi:hypothetical protein